MSLGGNSHFQCPISTLSGILSPAFLFDWHLNWSSKRVPRLSLWSWCVKMQIYMFSFMQKAQELGRKRGGKKPKFFCVYFPPPNISNTNWFLFSTIPTTTDHDTCLNKSLEWTANHKVALRKISKKSIILSLWGFLNLVINSPQLSWENNCCNDYYGCWIDSRLHLLFFYLVRLMCFLRFLLLCFIVLLFYFYFV